MARPRPLAAGGVGVHDTHVTGKTLATGRSGRGLLPARPPAGADTWAMLPALAIAAAVFVAGAAALYAPPATGEMAVVFAPGTDEVAAYAAILAAGGRFVAPTRLANIAVAYTDRTDFAERIRAFGGLFTLAAHGLCAPQQGSVP